MYAAENALYTEIRNFSKSWAEMTYVLAVPACGFKKCCLKSGRFEGTKRNHYSRG